MIKIIFQAESWIAVDKPANITVHNEPGKDLISVLSAQIKNAAKLYPVHRLDKETSGVILFATTSAMATELAGKWASDEIRKIYYALVRGKPLEANGKWADPISDKAEGRKNPQGLAKDRVAAETLYKVDKTSAHFSLLELEILSGRQHQIRKHTAIHRCPVVGDPRYGSEKLNQLMLDKYQFARMGLHAHQIEIQWQGRKQVIKSEVPKDFYQVMEQDRE